MKKMDLILGYILVAVSILFFYMTSQLPSDARIYPMFVIGLLLLLSIIHLIITYRKKDDEKSTMFDGLVLNQLLFVVGVSGLYVAAISIVGYITSTIAYVTSILFGLKVNKKTSLLISFGTALFIYITFKVLLRVPLPKGFII